MIDIPKVPARIHYTVNWPVFAIVVALLVFLGAAAYWFAHDPKSGSIVALFKKDGSVDQKLDHLFTFTTASYLTKYDLTEDRADDPARAKQFEVLKRDKLYYYVDDPNLADGFCSKHVVVTECLGAQVLAFKEALDALKTKVEDKRIQGYELFESMGSGSERIKRGLTWKVTVPEGSTFTRDDIIQLYVKFWHRTDGIYIEDFAIPKSRR